jgi:hypothetical protein
MIRFLFKAAVESIVLVAVLIGSFYALAEFGPKIFSNVGFEVETSGGERLGVEFHIYRKIPKMPRKLPPGIQLLPPSILQKG